jgi:hypothetical protein
MVQGLKCFSRPDHLGGAEAVCNAGCNILHVGRADDALPIALQQLAKYAGDVICLSRRNYWQGCRAPAGISRHCSIKLQDMLKQRGFG